MDPKLWRGRTVLVTGHTGFKGTWLSLWLHRLGAAVHGIALPPPTSPSIFEMTRASNLLASDNRIDIRDQNALSAAIARIAPEIVFHLAAQPLVSYSYKQPVETFAVNLMGTVHILEAIRATPTVRAVVVATTDKCYANHGKAILYKETDELGGHDPYSSSKACAELAISAYRNSFLAGAATATARAGNVVGGGDWANERLIPDCVRAHRSEGTLTLRYPQAVRPWQHVLEPLSGYLMLAEALQSDHSVEYRGPWNFGPNNSDIASVNSVVSLVRSIWPDISIRTSDAGPPFHETELLHLDSSKAAAQLGWKPRWTLRQAIEQTLAWYEASETPGADMRHFSFAQIAEYELLTDR